MIVHVPDGRRFGLLRRTPEIVIEAHVPAGTALVVKSKSADVQARGELGYDQDRRPARATSSSTDIDGVAVVESGSGDIQLGTIAGAATVKTGERRRA